MALYSDTEKTDRAATRKLTLTPHLHGYDLVSFN